MLTTAWKPCGWSSAANGPKVSQSINWYADRQKVGWGPEQHSRLVACICRVVPVQSTSSSSSHETEHLNPASVSSSQPSAHNDPIAMHAAFSQQRSEAKGSQSAHRGSAACHGGSRQAGVMGRENQSLKPTLASSPSPQLPREPRPRHTHTAGRSRSYQAEPALQASARNAEGVWNAARHSKPRVRDSHRPAKRTMPPLSLLLKHISLLPLGPSQAPSSPKSVPPAQHSLLSSEHVSRKPFAAQHGSFSTAHRSTGIACHASQHPQALNQHGQGPGWPQPHKRWEPAAHMDASSLASNAAHQLYLLAKIITGLPAGQQEQGTINRNEGSSSSNSRSNSSSISSSHSRVETEHSPRQRHAGHSTAKKDARQEGQTSEPESVPSGGGVVGPKQKQQAQRGGASSGPSKAGRLKRKQQEQIRAALVHLAGVLLGRAGTLALDNGVAKKEERAAVQQQQHPIIEQQQRQQQQQQQQQPESAVYKSARIDPHHFSTARGLPNSASRAADSAAAAAAVAAGTGTVGRGDGVPGRLPAAHKQPKLLAYLDARQLAMAAWALTKVRLWMSAADVDSMTAGILHTALAQSSTLKVHMQSPSSSHARQGGSPNDVGCSGSSSSSSSSSSNSGSPGSSSTPKENMEHASGENALSKVVEHMSSVNGAERGRSRQKAWGSRHSLVSHSNGEEDEEGDGDDDHGGGKGALYSEVMQDISHDGESQREKDDRHREKSSFGGSSTGSDSGQNSSSSSSSSSSSLSVSSKRSRSSGSMADADAHSWALLLHSLATLGVRCTKRSLAFALFSRGACAALPPLLSAGKAGDQDCSNALYGCVVAGLPLQRTKQLISALSAAVSSGWALHETHHSSHAWSTILWCLAKLEVYDRELVMRGAHAMAQASSQIKVPLQLANTLWALGGLGWYTPEVYCKLDRALVPFAAQMSPQEISIALLGCAHARHISAAVRDLCTLVCSYHWDAGRGCFCGWSMQDHTMTLYAWAVLRTSAVTADASGSNFVALDAFAAALFQSLAHMDPHPDSARPDQLCQLFQAHQTAHAPLVQLKQGGLRAGSYLLASAEDAWYNYVYQGASSAARYPDTSQVLQELVRALRIAGYRVARVMQPCVGPGNSNTVTTTVTPASNTSNFSKSSSWGSGDLGALGLSSIGSSNGFSTYGYSLDGFTSAGPRGAILGPILIDILVPHPSCVNGIALELSAQGEYLHKPSAAGHPSSASLSKHPKGRMRGPPFMRLWHIRQWCDAVVLVREEEWANLRGDPLRQRDYMAYRMRYALEAAADSKKMAVHEAVAAAAAAAAAPAVPKSVFAPKSAAAAAAPSVASAAASTDGAPLASGVGSAAAPSVAAAAAAADNVTSAAASTDAAPVALLEQRHGSLVHGLAGAARGRDGAVRWTAPVVPSQDVQLDHHTPQHHSSATGQASSTPSTPDYSSSTAESAVLHLPGPPDRTPEHGASSGESAVHKSCLGPQCAVHNSPVDNSPVDPLSKAHSSSADFAPVLHAPVPPPPPSLALKARPLRLESPPHSPSGPASTGATPDVPHLQSEQVRQMWPPNMPPSTAAQQGSASLHSTRAVGLGDGTRTVELGVRAVPKKVRVKPRLAPVISGYTRTSLGYSIQWPDGSTSRSGSSNSSSRERSSSSRGGGREGLGSSSSSSSSSSSNRDSSISSKSKNIGSSSQEGVAGAAANPPSWV